MSEYSADSLRASYRVSTAGDGREGLAKALELRPDLVITDVMMPEMSGDALVRAIRARAELARVRVLLLTAKADDALRVKMLREGADDFVTKPFSVDELMARVASQIARLGCRKEEARGAVHFVHGGDAEVVEMRE